MFHVGYSEMVAYGVNTDEDYYEDGYFKSRLPPELAFRPENPWHADARVTEDFVLIAEFSEQEGPKPLETIPEQGGGRFDKNNFAVRIMSADYQTHGSASGFCLVEDTHVVMMDTKEGACAYVHHFTLFDLQARGFVRPFCMSYVTTDRSKIMTNLEEMMSEFKKVSSVFKYGNRLMFVQELEHRLADLQYTRDKYEQWQKQKDSGKLTSVDLEEAAILDTISLATLDRVTQETVDILRTVRPSLNNPRLERHFRRLQDRSQAQAGRQDASSANSEDGCHSNASHCSEEDGGKLGMMPENGVPYVPKVTRPDSSKQFDRELRRLDQLCGQGEKEGLNRLRQIQKFFSRDLMAVSMEKKESKLIDPPPGLLTFGRCVAMNFLHNLDLQCAGGCWPLGQTGRTELQHPARNLFRRWMSSESLSSLYTTDSFQSGLESRGATHSLDPTFLPASSYKSIDSVYYDYEEDDDLNYDSDSLEILSSSETSGTMHFLEETTLTLRPSTVNIEESSPFHGLLSTAIGRRDTPTQDTYHSLKDSSSFSEDLLSNNSIDVLEDTEEMSPKEIRVLRRRSKSEGNDSVDTIHGESPSVVEEDSKKSATPSSEQVCIVKQTPEESRTDCLEGATEHQSQEKQVETPSELDLERRICTEKEEETISEDPEGVSEQESEDKQMKMNGRNCTKEEAEMCNNVSNLSSEVKEEAMLSVDRFEPSGNSEFASAKSSVVEEFNTPAQNTPRSSISSMRSDVHQDAAGLPLPYDLTLDPGSVASSINSDCYSVPDSPTDNRSETPSEHRQRKNRAVAVTSMGSTGSDSAGGSWPSSGEAGTVESRHIRMSVCSYGDHICNFGPQLPGYGVVRFMKQYVFAAHVIYALLTGRPLVVLGLPRQEREVRGLVTTLSLFVPGFSNRYHTVTPWHTSPLCLTDICNTKLIGLAKVKPADRMIPSSVKRYVSVFDCDKKTLTTPQYQGTYINAIVSRKKDFKVDEPYIGYIHSTLLELASKAFLYYHSYCLNSPNVENMQSHDGEKLQKKSAAGFLGKLGVQDGDAKVVEYLAEIIKQQQVDDLLLRHDKQTRSRDSELPPPPIRTEYRACSQYRV